MTVHTTVPLGELVVAMFDEAARHGTDPRDIPRLATVAVLRFLRHPNGASADKNRILVEALEDASALAWGVDRDAGLHGRIENNPSTEQKMRLSRLGRDLILDALGIRVMVQDNEQCFRLIARIHRRFPAIESEYDDYITSPKINGHRSLLTTIHGLDQVPMEVQARTSTMHEHAERGASSLRLYRNVATGAVEDQVLAGVFHRTKAVRVPLQSRASAASLMPSEGVTTLRDIALGSAPAKDTAETEGKPSVSRQAKPGENDSDRLRRITTPEAMSVDLVSAFAGDRAMTAAEAAFIDSQRKIRGSVFYSDLLYAITHRHFAPEVAVVLWENVLTHKHLVSEQLDRNVGIAVASLDYLSNVTSNLRSFTLISESYVSKIAELSMRDGMTRLFNHSSCFELLELEYRNYHRNGVGLALMLLDIDDFKSVNDRIGHPGGDRVLVDLANALTERTRESDICCRIGGDEFAVILRQTSDPAEVWDLAPAAAVAAETPSFPVAEGVDLLARDDAIPTLRAIGSCVA